ncbi:DUF5999 family protein [Streptomyces chromofuscus]|uniref:DUF5999 family protein n=1 Tax=Streptomyces chromofuscus TaxID=42881 RepID=UPI001D149A93|nr:DUF5999 family protein [Streptomyces chromofuscus]
MARVITALGAAGLVCGHSVACPPARARDCETAKIRVHRPKIECSELCNGVLILEGTGYLLPSGDVVGLRQPLPREAVTT